MGELESLLLVLALIYLSECLVWVPRGALAFSSWRGIRFGIRFSGSWIGNQHGGLLLSNPLPPLDNERAVAEWVLVILLPPPIDLDVPVKMQQWIQGKHGGGALPA